MPGLRPAEQDPGRHLLPQTVADIRLGAIKANVKALKGLTAADTKFMAVVKANAYGHGALPVARAALDAGADFLAVARISEAAALRQAGIRSPMLLFGDVLPEQAAWLAANDVRASITDLDSARKIAGAIDGSSPALKVHIKVDTGMGRLGFVHDGAGYQSAATVDEILEIKALKGLAVEGIYTHMAKADETDKTFAKLQVERFSQITRTLADKGLSPLIRHMAASAGLIDLPESHFDMVRPGIAMYGMWPSNEVDTSRVHLTPAMTIRSKIIQVKSVPQGFPVSYGCTHVTPAPTRIATVPIGYADGYSRLLSGKGTMLVNGKRARVVGRVCMDFTMIDVGHIPDACVGDEVVIMGTQDGETVSADEIARLTGTINYEVTAGLTGRIPLRHT